MRRQKEKQKRKEMHINIGQYEDVYRVPHTSICAPVCMKGQLKHRNIEILKKTKERYGNVKTLTDVEMIM